MITETGTLHSKMQVKFEEEPFFSQKDLQPGRIYEKQKHLHNSSLSSFNTFSKLHFYYSRLLQLFCPVLVHFFMEVMISCS